MIKKIKIGKKWIGEGEPCFIIVEAGSNHNQKFSQAKKLVNIAKAAGADAVKFQYFKAERLYPRKDDKVEYLKDLGIRKPVFKLIKDIQMPDDWVEKLAKYCKKKDIIFLVSPFSEEDVDIINPYVPAFKIASYEITHMPLIRYVAKKGKPMIISTGAVKKINEIKQAIVAAKNVGNSKICLMQCTAKYPAPLESVNARVVQTLKKEFQIPVGLSDHSFHPLYGAAAAIAAGANLYEKHFTISRKMRGPDHSFALEPNELRECVDLIRNTEIALGSKEKKLQKVEEELVNYRRSIYTVKNIKAGDKFTKDNIKVLRRPGIKKEGLMPVQYPEVLGKKARKNLTAFELMKKDDVF